jgi:soluble lytic murein transglycosylase-like protein
MQEIINQKARQFDIDPKLIRAFCTVESSMNPYACRYEPAFYDRYILPLTVESLRLRNPLMQATRIPTIATERIQLATSWGLMQIMGQTAREFGFRGQFLAELTDPATGLEYALKYLQRKLNAYSDIRDAISAYNAGHPSNLNQDYVDRILSL